VRQSGRGRAANLVSQGHRGYRGHRGHPAQRGRQDQPVRKVRRAWRATKDPKDLKAHQGQRESLVLRVPPVLKDPLGCQAQSGQSAKQVHLALPDQ
jgi:hypothetical protein